MRPSPWIRVHASTSPLLKWIKELTSSRSGLLLLIGLFHEDGSNATLSLDQSLCKRLALAEPDHGIDLEQVTPIVAHSPLPRGRV